jgi:hypothetical protein
LKNKLKTLSKKLKSQVPNNFYCPLDTKPATKAPKPIMQSISRFGFNAPITPVNWNIQATNAARMAAAENAPKDTTSWPSDDTSRANFMTRVALSMMGTSNWLVSEEELSSLCKQERPNRAAAVKALEKIKAMAKEAEKYDKFGEEIEESIETTEEPISVKESEESISVKKPIEIKRESINFTPAKVPESGEPLKKHLEKTPNTLWGIASGDKESFNAFGKYNNTLKSINVTNVKEYLIAAEVNENKYIVIPELIKYLIANPSLLLYHDNFGRTVVNKMLEFEAHMVTNKTISGFEITEEYRREFIGLVKILRKVSQMYGKLRLNDQSFYDNIDKIADAL